MKLKNLFLDFGIYLFCFAGVMSTKVIPDLKAENIEVVLPSWKSLLGSAVIAVLAVAIGERSGEIQGKRTRFKRRAFTAFLLGAFWVEIMAKVF